MCVNSRLYCTHFSCHWHKIHNVSRQLTQISKRQPTTATAGRGGSQVLLYSSRQFSSHPKSSLAHIDKRAAQAARNTCYRYNQIGSLDHKMADNCVSLAHTNTVSSTITKLIKSWKTSNKSWSYNLLNCANKMYRHDLFNLHQALEAWLAPVHKQIQTTKSLLMQCTKY